MSTELLLGLSEAVVLSDLRGVVTPLSGPSPSAQSKEHRVPQNIARDRWERP